MERGSPRAPDALEEQDPPESLDALVAQAAVLLEVRGAVGVVVVEVPTLAAIEASCGAEVYEDVLDVLGSRVRALEALAERGRILCGADPSDRFVVFVAGDQETLDGRLEDLADEIAELLGPVVAGLTQGFGLRPVVRVGYELVLRSGMVSAVRAMQRGLEQARRMASDRAGRQAIRARERLHALLSDGGLDTVLQPMVDLESGRPRAFEVLARGPRGTALEAPSALFDLAEQAGATAQLDRTCCELALERARALPVGTLLFVNALPALFNDRDLWLRLQGGGLDPRRIVLEVNEGAVIHGREVFEHAVRELRESGVRIAIDDLGAGWANMEQILRLEPEFLKLDMGLIRGVHESGLKRALVTSMVGVARAFGAVVVAEGIEVPAELDTLREIGVQWGQGWLLGRPGPGFQRTDAPAPA